MNDAGENCHGCDAQFPCVVAALLYRPADAAASGKPAYDRLYRDTFRLLLRFAQMRLGRQPSQLAFEQIDAPLIAAFLDETRTNAGSRPAAATYASPRFARSSAMPLSRRRPMRSRFSGCSRFPASVSRVAQVGFLTRPESAAAGRARSADVVGRRDHALLLLAVPSRTTPVRADRDAARYGDPGIQCPRPGHAGKAAKNAPHR